MKPVTLKQSHQIKLYIILFSTALLSLLATIFVDLSETMKILTSTPLVGALLVALFQILRDDEQFLRDSIMQDREHNFMLAATSHMSKVVFDKHVQFSENYLSQVTIVISDLFLSGLSGESTQNEVAKLADIRHRYKLWLSIDMGQKLSEAEKRLDEIA